MRVSFTTPDVARLDIFDSFSHDYTFWARIIVCPYVAERGDMFALLDAFTARRSLLRAVEVLKHYTASLASLDAFRDNGRI